MRLKLPAYGKSLLERRRAGDHPMIVALVYGRDWNVDVGGVPKLVLKPEDYEPGQVYLDVLAGLHVKIYDQGLGAADCNVSVSPPTYGKFFDLLHDVASVDACFTLWWPARSGWEPETDIDFAHSHRWIERASGKSVWQWPRWWSQELQTRARRRSVLWCADVALAPLPEPLSKECGEASR